MIQGQHTLFKVALFKTGDVANLKDAIKAKKPNTLHNVEVDELTLWKVSGFLTLPKPCS
jgi:hypothetical protein